MNQYDRIIRKRNFKINIMVDTYHLIITGIATCLGLGLVASSQKLTKVQNELNEKETTISKHEQAEKYFVSDMGRIREECASGERSRQRLSRNIDELNKAYNKKRKELEESLIILDQTKFERDHYKNQVRQQEKLINVDFNDFYDPGKVNAFGYQLTLRGADLFKSEAEIESRIRKDLAEVIASQFNIKLIESRDHEGLRKDIQIKYILKQLDYEI